MTSPADTFSRVRAGRMTVGRYTPPDGRRLTLVRTGHGWDVLLRGRLVAFTGPRPRSITRHVQPAGHMHHDRPLRWTDGFCIRWRDRVFFLIRP